MNTLVLVLRIFQGCISLGIIGHCMRLFTRILELLVKLADFFAWKAHVRSLCVRHGRVTEHVDVLEHVSEILFLDVLVMHLLKISIIRKRRLIRFMDLVLLLVLGELVLDQLVQGKVGVLICGQVIIGEG